jgi:hypothetical protein
MADMTNRCEPPINTPAGTVCVLEHATPKVAGGRQVTWQGNGRWNIATVGTIIVEAAELADGGWRFVRVAETGEGDE